MLSDPRIQLLSGRSSVQLRPGAPILSVTPSAHVELPHVGARHQLQSDVVAGFTGLGACGEQQHMRVVGSVFKYACKAK